MFNDDSPVHLLLCAGTELPTIFRRLRAVFVTIYLKSSLVVCVEGKVRIVQKEDVKINLLYKR